jgi:hypothetical protein
MIHLALSDVKNQIRSMSSEVSTTMLILHNCMSCDEILSTEVDKISAR